MKKALFCIVALCVCHAFAFEYTLKSGDYEIRMTAHYKQIIRSITYQGGLLSTPNGFYGSVIVPKSGKYIGAGHSEGGLERLLSYTVICDGVQVEPAKDAVLSGKKLIVEKVSQYDNLLMHCIIELTPDGLVETKRGITVALQTFWQLDPHIFCVNKSMTHYCALTADGKYLQHKFLKQKNDWHINTDVKYVAEYDEVMKKGILFYYPEVIEGMSRKSAIWEVLKGYNKYYKFAKAPSSVPAGWQTPVYTVCVKGFAAENAEAFPGAVKTAVDDAAKIQVPTVSIPEN